MSTPPLGQSDAAEGRKSYESTSSVSTTSLVFDRIGERLEREHATGPDRKASERNGGGAYGHQADNLSDFDDPLKDEHNADDDLETGPFLGGDGSPRTGMHGLSTPNKMDRTMRRVLIAVAGLLVGAWVGSLVWYIASKSYQHSSQIAHDPQATVTRGSGKEVTLDQVMEGFWSPQTNYVSWISGANGEDGLLLEEGAEGKDFLVIEDVRAQNPAGVSGAGDVRPLSSLTLMKSGFFEYGGTSHYSAYTKPSKNFKKVLIGTEVVSNWRHSKTMVYWILDVQTQVVEPLIPGEPGARCQLAQWSPTSDIISFTRDNNLFIRRLNANTIVQITQDGSPEVFNGVPDWVYEEEVLGGNSATWWSGNGTYIAFMRTNETGVPDFPVQYFLSRPSGQKAPPGEENYPETRLIKYPRPGSHNPIVDLKFYDTTRGDVFSVDISGGFEDEDRLITAVVWAGEQVVIKETNRVSDVMHVVLVDVVARSGKTVRTMDVKSLDGGWFEISHSTTYIPADPSKGRAQAGYIDTVIYDDGDHLGYFTPLDNPEPIMLTKGNWEVVDGPSAVDLEHNLVYFQATKVSSIQRHFYQVTLTGENMTPITDTSAEGYYAMSFSHGSGYALMSYRGPGIPWQKVISTPSNPIKYEHTLENNADLAEKARKHELPLLVYGTINVDGVELNYVERRPPHFDERKTYPVIFQQYSGPGSQTVDKRFKVDFQSYLAAGLGYVCVTVDGRGTGFIGRKNRVLVRGELGKWEAHDQIAAAKIWAAKKYVDASRIAIWGWSYGGFQTLKTLEQDAGQTFSYGMAVAPVTDWRFYDSIYTERYMLTPQTNEGGYERTAVSNVTALGQNVRFLLMHGVADDNVHFQNSLTLLDKLDLAGIENYDVHVFPDSDHSIYFHNANRIVYDSKFHSLSLSPVL